MPSVFVTQLLLVVVAIDFGLDTLGKNSIRSESMLLLSFSFLLFCWLVALTSV